MVGGDRPSRRERERLRHRSEILQAALDLFSEKGYHNVSMHEIAEKAEFGVGTLYSFFENKEELYKTLMMEQAQRFHSALTRAIQSGRDEREKIMNYIRAKGEVFMAGAKAIRLYFAEAKGMSFNIKAGLDTDIRARYERFLQELSAVFESGIRKGLFRAESPYYLAVSLDALTNAFLFCWLDDPERHEYERNTSLIASFFFD